MTDNKKIIVYIDFLKQSCIISQAILTSVCFSSLFLKLQFLHFRAFVKNPIIMLKKMSIARQNNNQTQPFKTARKMDKKRNNRNLIMDKMIAEYLEFLYFYHILRLLTN
jgi:hypothetical protein